VTSGEHWSRTIDADKRQMVTFSLRWNQFASFWDAALSLAMRAARLARW
jgi:hypothetical protein